MLSRSEAAAAAGHFRKALQLWRAEHWPGFPGFPVDRDRVMGRDPHQTAARDTKVVQRRAASSAGGAPVAMHSAR